jgi:hypothetical protein
MSAEVVRWVRIQHTQTFVNEKYSKNFHVLIAKGMFRDMQLVVVGSGQQRAKLLDPNMT